MSICCYKNLTVTSNFQTNKVFFLTFVVSSSFHFFKQNFYNPQNQPSSKKQIIKSSFSGLCLVMMSLAKNSIEKLKKLYSLRIFLCLNNSQYVKQLKIKSKKVLRTGSFSFGAYYTKPEWRREQLYLSPSFQPTRFTKVWIGNFYFLFQFLTSNLTESFSL